MFHKLLLVLMICVSTVSILAANESYGTIFGKISHSDTKEPLSGVNVFVNDTNLGTTSNGNGEYSIGKITVGIYSISFQYIGFKALTKTDIIIKPGRITFVNAGLKETAIESETIVITAEYFQKEESDPLSLVNFNAEELRRAPGSAGDISRILKSLPSAAQTTDSNNDLMVRGGSPTENGFYVDNIMIPNINHFPVQGASGGAIGMLNVDFIENVNFHAGGFSSVYGDKLSSVIDIEFRDGNREEFDGQVDFDMAGFGMILEGPLPKSKGSWFISGRKSYLDLIVDGLGLEGMVPRYGDVHAKLSLDLNPRHKLTFLNIYGTSDIGISQKQAEKDANSAFGELTNHENSIGFNWRALWQGNGYSNTSLSYSFITSNDMWYDVKTSDFEQGNDYLEGAVRLRNRNYYQLNQRNKVEFGLDASVEFANYDYFFTSYTNRLGEEVPELTVDDSFNSSKAGIFLNYINNPTSRWTNSLGLRFDYYAFNDRIHMSPRFSSAYQLSNRMTINAATGIFYQQLPVFLMSQETNNRKLDDPMAVHYVVGIDYMLTSDTKLSLEMYNKEYYNFPLEPSDPYLFVIDDGGSYRYFRRYENLQDNGRANSRGIELLIQKKLAKDFYGLISGTWFRSRYRDYEGSWRNRVYDNQYLVTVSGGYRPSRKWEFSARWTYAGGIPYTPFDQTLSAEYNVGIIDHKNINGKRQPDYHSLNLRIDRRFFFNKSSLVSYLSVWNAYNRKNIAVYYWDEVDKKQETLYQWSFIPLLGFEYEF